MSDFPQLPAFGDGSITISPFSRASVGLQLARGAPSSAVWPGANQANLIPFRLAAPAIAQRMWLFNGSAVAGNVDVGIYDVAGTRLVSSGSIAQAGTSVIQEFDITDTLLGRGVFYLAVAMSSGSATNQRIAASLNAMKLAGCARMDTAFPLPATITFTTISSSFCPLVGVVFRSVS